MSAPEPAAGGDPRAELDALFPDRDVPVRDPDTGAAAALTVREFRFLEGLRAQALARPLVQAWAALAPGDGELADAGAFEAAMAEHAETWLALLALATGRDAGWLARLPDADGRALSDAMWSVNGSFFVRRVVAEVAARRAASLSPSPGSSTPSSAPGTATDTPISPGD